MGSKDERSFLDDLRRGAGTSIRNNSTAYGFSVLVTADFAVMSHLGGPPDLAGIYAFLAGAALAFAVLSAAASKLFRENLSSEPSKVIALSSAFGFVSIGLGVSVSVFVGWLSTGWYAWLASGFASTATYILLVGVEVVLAEHIERGREAKS